MTRTDDKNSRPMAQDCEVQLQRLTLAGLHWGAPPSPQAPVIALHGWLDNAASFGVLAPELAQYRAVTGFDLPGHGRSDPRPSGYPYHLLDYVQDLADLVRSQPEPVHVVGHSLGGILAALLASAGAENILSLTVIDSLGPFVARAEDFPARLHKGIEKALRRERNAMPVYDSVAAAEQARQAGQLPLSAFAARQLVRRNLQEVPGGWSWRTDPRLRNPSLSALTEEQVQACLAAIDTPVLLLRAENGMLAADKRLQARKAAVRHLTCERVQGSHHCHIDGDVPAIAAIIERFLRRCESPAESAVLENYSDR